jgi:uncharacterized protein YbcI
MAEDLEVSRSTLDRIGADIASLYRRSYGRGPESTRTYGDRNLVVCVLREGLTPFEATLVDSGHGRTVNDVRSLFQEALKDDLVRIVEHRTGRTVQSFASGWDAEEEHAYEIFLLTPLDPDPVPPR